MYKSLKKTDDDHNIKTLPKICPSVSSRFVTLRAPKEEADKKWYFSWLTGIGVNSCVPLIVATLLWCTSLGGCGDPRDRPMGTILGRSYHDNLAVAASVQFPRNSRSSGCSNDEGTNKGPSNGRSTHIGRTDGTFQKSTHTPSDHRALSWGCHIF
jgi:hypothetical protein